MSNDYKDVIRNFPQPKRIGLQVPGSPTITGDKSNPVLMINISIPLQPDFIANAVKASLAMGTDKTIVLRFLYQLDDVVQRLIEEIESSDDVNVKRKVL
jgi:hypothetical protein